MTAFFASSPGSGLSLNPAADLSQMLGQHFMVNALLAASAVALLAGAVGWFMVLRRQTFAGHTLAMVAFPGAAGAALVGIGATTGYFGAAVLAAVAIGGSPRSSGDTDHRHETAVIGTVQAFALACGAMFVSLYGGFLNGLTGLLFGTFLGISDAQVLTLVAVTAGALGVLALIGRPLFFATLDADGARARGVPVHRLDVGFLVLLGCGAAEVSQITGVLLVFALLVMPASSAQRLTARPGLSLTLTIAIGLVVAWLGLSAAYYSTYPVGFFVTGFGFVVYVACSLIGGRSGGSPVSSGPV
jgi:zinc/manganese transport system permease protein